MNGLGITAKAAIGPVFFCVNFGWHLLASGLTLSDGGIFKGFGPLLDSLAEYAFIVLLISCIS